MGRRGTETAPTTDEMAKLAELEAGEQASQCGAEKEVTGREEEERCD